MSSCGVRSGRLAEARGSVIGSLVERENVVGDNLAEFIPCALVWRTACDATQASRVTGNASDSNDTSDLCGDLEVKRRRWKRRLDVVESWLSPSSLRT